MNDIYNTHIETLIDLAQTTQMLGLEVNVMKLKEVFYEQHKRIYGSNKDKMYDGESYQRTMLDRYTYIEDGINCIIEAKQDYERINTERK